MGDTPSIYSDFQYERLRLRLLAFQRKHSKTPQAIANDIVSRTGYAMTYDGGRKRVDRFLQNANRASDDFVAAVEAFLGDFQLIDYESAALALSKLTRGPRGAPSAEDIVRFAGVYHGEMTGLVTFAEEEESSEDGSVQRSWQTKTLEGPAFPVFRMAPMHNHAGLFVWAANALMKPEDGARPEDLQNVPSRGIASRFGRDGLLIVISEPHGSFYYNVRIASDEPFALYGNGQHFSYDADEPEQTRPLPPIDPHCEIRMVRIKDQDGE
tara:strand:- start:2470 stop:3273 length:804 start_codon:yes stop_codon:yes gene_type:complete